MGNWLISMAVKSPCKKAEAIYTGRNRLAARGYRISRILTLLIQNLKPISKTLSTAADSLLRTMSIRAEKATNNGINIIMYALDDRRNKLKDKICVNVGAKGELTAQ